MASSNQGNQDEGKKNMGTPSQESDRGQAGESSQDQSGKGGQSDTVKSRPDQEGRCYRLP